MRNAILAAVFVLGTLAAPASARGAEPDASAAAAHLAETRGGVPADFRLVYEQTASIPGSADPVWVGKFSDPAGELVTVYREASGRVGGAEVLRDRAAQVTAGQDALTRKADGRLRDRVTLAGARERVPVTVWLRTDASAAVDAVIARHPAVAWADGRPVATSMEQARLLRADLFNAKRAIIASVAEAFAAEVRAAGGEVAYVSSAAPLVVADVPAARVAQLASLESVESMSLEQAWVPTMTSAGPTVDANWTTGSGDQGNGIRVAVVEYHNVRNSGDLSGRVVASFSTTGSLAYASGSAFDHPTWVAGAVAGGGAYPGVAPGSRIVSASTGGGGASLARDRAVIAAADWAVSPTGGDADVVNVSLIQDTSTGSEEARRYFDSVVFEDLRVVVAAAGNYSALGTWRVGSPGTGWNVLTVGGTDDRNTGSRADDRIWYVPGSNGSSYLDPPGTAWNPHGDFNKPNLSAPAVNVVTSNGLGASGTSASTPIVSGIVAQVMAREPVLAFWPETVRALLMAGAVHRTRMPDGSYNPDHEGAGSASALWSNRILVAGDGASGGYRQGSLTGVLTQQVAVFGGQRIKLALSWNSRTSGSGNLAKSDSLASDLDLVVRLPNGAVVGSYSLDNSYEVIDVVSPISGTLTVEVRPARLGAGGERFALAWAKIGGDGNAPVVTATAPVDGEPWSPQGASVTATFNEPVTGLTGSSVMLVTSGGSRVAASLSYAATQRRLTISPSAPLPPGAYRVTLTDGVRDHAGNRLAPVSWQFQVVSSAAPWQTALSPARRVAFAAGTHTGYLFGADGRVTGSRTATLAAASGASADRRALIGGQPGRWLRIIDGMWAGYWIRESPRAAVRGLLEEEALPSTTRIAFAAGSHTGYQFAADGRVTGTKVASLAAASGANTTSRALINGAWHHDIINGIWAGYWVQESARSYRFGMIDHRDLASATVRFAAGSHTGLRIGPDGAVAGTRSASLARASSAPGLAWAVVHGAPSILVGAGIWSGHWVPESDRVQVP